MLRIINETGVAHDTRVLGKDGEDITRLMQISGINIDIAVEDAVKTSLSIAMMAFDLSVDKVRWILLNKTVNSVQFDDGTHVDLSGDLPVWTYAGTGDML